MALNDSTDHPNSLIDQACAIPFRTAGAQIEFCLITASSGRWLFPKGFVEPGETFAEAALKEALEEAGVHGRVIGDPVGRFEIKKNGQPRTVIALLMEVLHCDAVWEEAAVRQRRWVSRKEARRLITAPELLELLDTAHAQLRVA
ncbi:MAG: NUDIX hydrolase [Planctomycetota bacterium]